MRNTYRNGSKLVRRFGVLSLVCMLGVAVALGFGAARVVGDQLIRHEATDLAETLQVILPRAIPQDVFEKPAGMPSAIGSVLDGLRPSNGIVRVLVYDRAGSVLWSDDDTLIGRRFGENPEFDAALRGRVSVSVVRPGGEGHHASLPKADRFLEIYVPVRYGPNAPVVGVLEIYHDAPELFALLDRTVMVLWILGALAGAALYVMLLVIVRQSAARQLALEAELRTHASTLEEQVAQRTAELRETRDYLRNIIESSADAIVTLDVHGVITSVSKAALRIFDGRPEALIGTHARAHWIRGPRDFRTVRCALVREARLQNYETEVRTADGRAVAVEVSASLLRSPDGRVGGIVAVLRDVTERRALYEQAIQTERLATAGRLAAGVAHEVGNPLACVSSLAETLSQQTTEGRMQGGLEQIQHHVERVERIVRDLTRLARPSRLSIRRVSVGELLQSAVELGRHAPSARKTRITLTCESDALYVSVDPDRIVQVFLNLILNAADAGGDLEISASRINDQVNVMFHDNGRGIPAEMLPQVFDPFFSTKTERHAGLGLFVSHETIRQHGGVLLVESQLGLGSTFTVRLPCARASRTQVTNGATVVA